MRRDRLLALTAWREALRRAGPERPALYARMLSSASTVSPAFNRALEEFGGTQADLALTYLARASGENFKAAVNRLLEHDVSLQTLTMEQRAQLFDLWTDHGDTEQLASYAAAHPEWLGLAWRGVAKHRAALGDFHGAVDLVSRFGERPKLPEAAGGASIEQLQKAFFTNPSDYQTGFALYRQQTQEQKLDDALTTVRRFTAQENGPAFFHYLESQSWAAKENWERAWRAWENYQIAKVKQH